MKFIKNLALLLAISAATPALADVAVIINPGNGNSISQNDIARAFLGKLKKFSDGQSITAVNSTPDNQVRIDFQQKVLKKSPAQVKAYWSKRLFSGKGKPLQELGSDAEVLKFVAANANAIGYIDAANVDGSVKVISTF